MSLTGEAALKEARRIARDHRLYIVTKPHTYLLYREVEHSNRGILVHRSPSAKAILEATRRHAGVPAPETEEAAF